MKKFSLLALGGVLAAVASTTAHADAARLTVAIKQTVPRADFALTDTKVAVVAGQRDLGRTADTTAMRISVGLATRNDAMIQTLLRRQNTPGDPMFRHFLKPVETANLFSPTGASVQAASTYLASQGFTNLKVSPDNLIITANGTAASVNRAFDTEMHTMVVGNKPFLMNTRSVAVPKKLAGVIRQVVGLNGLAVMHTNLAFPTKPKGYATPFGATCTTAAANQDCVLNDFNNRQFITTYDGGNQKVTGQQTEIAIITQGDMSKTVADLRDEENREQLPQTPVQMIYAGIPSTDAAGADEWDLDAQFSTGFAGGVKKLDMYVATSLTDADLAVAIDRFKTDDIAKAASASLGGCEAFSATDGSMVLTDKIFAEAAVQGQSFFASTGDEGSACTVVANTGTPAGPPSVEYPSSSPYVTAVGGTTLFALRNDLYQGEISWIGGGGGMSTFESPGFWQSGVVSAAATTAGYRVTPDIAYDADPNTGADVVVNGAILQIGGTSLSSPLALGQWARIESYYGNTLGFASTILYKEFKDAGGVVTTPDPAKAGFFTTTVGGFNDVLKGSNGMYQAAQGYDETTGLGSMDINKTLTNILK